MWTKFRFLENYVIYPDIEKTTVYNRGTPLEISFLPAKHH